MKGFPRVLVPIFNLLCLGYFDFASCYALGYKEIYLHGSSGVAISLWVILAICQVLLLIYVSIALKKGPGTAPKIPPYDIHNTGDPSLSQLPDYFPCDENGFPVWCSNCQSIKGARVHHTKTYNRCVPRMDHFCVWVGGVVGRDNYRPFLKFLQWCLCYFISILGYLIAYTKPNSTRGEINHNFIVLYVVCGFWFIIISALFVSHLWYIVNNMTTMDDMSNKRVRKAIRARKESANRQKRKQQRDKKRGMDVGEGVETIGVDVDVDVSDFRFINVNRGDFRLVIQCPINKNWFDFGVVKNWINVVLYDGSMYFYPEERFYSWGKFVESLGVFIVPLIDLVYVQPEEEEVSLGPKFRDWIESKVVERRCYLPGYVRPEELQGEGERGEGERGEGERGEGERGEGERGEGERDETIENERQNREEIEDGGIEGEKTGQESDDTIHS